MSNLITVLAAAEGPNDPILPPTEEVIWGTLAFLVIAGALWKWAYPPARKALIGRRTSIEDDLQQTADDRAAAEAEFEEVRRRLSDADTERQRIVEEARQSAEALKRDSEQRTRQDVEEMKARAQRDLAASQQQAMSDLTAMVADLTLDAAEVVVRNSLDEATQRRLIDNYIEQLGTN